MATLTVTESYSDRLLIFIASLAKAPVSFSVGSSISYSGASERVTIAKALVASTDLANVTPAVEQWLNKEDYTEADLTVLESTLTSFSYVAGPVFTIADAAVFYMANPLMQKLGKGGLAKFPQVTRWLRQVTNETRYPLTSTLGSPAGAVTVAAAKPLRLFSSSAAPAAPAAGAKKEKTAAPKAAEAAASTEGAGASAAAPADGAAAGAGKKEKKEKEKKPAAPAPAPAPELDPVSYCDLRVGYITKVWPHPDADKLWCEEIEVGEAAPRRIASGLRLHYTQEEMTNRRVIVACNLKPRTMLGFESQGMVLAATSPEGKVELLDVPEAAKAGERVTFPGHENVECTPNVLAKKKYFDLAAAEFKVDDQLRASYKGVVFTTSAGPCTVPTAKGGSIH